MYAIRSYYDPGGAPHHHHLQHLVGGDAGILEGPAAGQQGLLHQGLDQCIELAAAQFPLRITSYNVCYTKLLRIIYV